MLRLLVLFLPFLAVAAKIFWIWAVRDAVRRHPHRFATLSRPVWIAVILLLPVLGAALYWAAGRVEEPSRH